MLNLPGQRPPPAVPAVPVLDTDARMEFQNKYVYMYIYIYIYIGVYMIIYAGRNLLPIVYHTRLSILLSTEF